MSRAQALSRPNSNYIAIFSYVKVYLNCTEVKVSLPKKKKKLLEIKQSTIIKTTYMKVKSCD